MKRNDKRESDRRKERKKGEEKAERKKRKERKTEEKRKDRQTERKDEKKKQGKRNKDGKRGIEKNTLTIFKTQYSTRTIFGNVNSYQISFSPDVNPTSRLSKELHVQTPEEKADRNSKKETKH